jgi:glycosyltransferase involved in cell wall biosynthesis
MTAGPPALSVVVPTRDRPGPLAACLAALEAQTATSFEVVVVDDASTDAAADGEAVADAPHARLVHGAGRGPAAARNAGTRAARGPVVCFTDDDCRPVPGWLDAVQDRMAAGAEAVAGPTRNGRPRSPAAEASQRITNVFTASTADAHGRTVGFAPTSNLAVRADLARRLPFDETFPLAAGEDRDWCERLAALGVPLAWEPAAAVDHHQDLGVRGFWRQQRRYGRGAARLHRGRPAGDRLRPARFYAGLLREGAAGGPAVAALVLLGQVAVAAGLAAEAVSARAAARRPSRR